MWICVRGRGGGVSGNVDGEKLLFFLGLDKIEYFLFVKVNINRSGEIVESKLIKLLGSCPNYRTLSSSFLW